MQHNNQSNTANRAIYSVSELNRSAATVLEQNFSWIWVEGEISNLAQPASGHIYFSLKDAKAQVRCAMFKSRNQVLNFQPENGLQVQVRGKVSLYQPRGDYQLIIDRMEEAGNGALQRKFEALKNKLAAEGLFDQEVKQDIPELPECIGVITSNSGAAIHDVLSVIARRFPAIPVKLYSVPVQGEAAAPAICRALELAEEQAECDVLLLVRGGGSLEDLWAFNEEIVAHAIYDCPIPVVSGVGHEVDVTIADFVADIRAATPTAAAETVTPDQSTWLQSLEWHQYRLQQLINEKIQRRNETLGWLRKRLSQQHPVAVVQRLSQRLDDIEQRLNYAWRYTLQQQQHRFHNLRTRLQTASPELAISNYQNRLQILGQNLHHQIKQTLDQPKVQLQFYKQNLHHYMQQTLERQKARLQNNARTLNAISPLNTLERGYSITSNSEGKTITHSDEVSVGDDIRTRLHRGQIISQIKKILA